MKVFHCQPGHPRKSSRSFRVQPLHHSPCGTMISPCISERKLCVCLMLTDTPSCPSGCIISDLRQYPDYPENKQRQGGKSPLCSPGFFSFHRNLRKELIAEVYSLQSSHLFLDLKKQKQKKNPKKKAKHLYNKTLVILGMVRKWTSKCPTLLPRVSEKETDMPFKMYQSIYKKCSCIFGKGGKGLMCGMVNSTHLQPTL